MSANIKWFTACQPILSGLQYVSHYLVLYSMSAIIKWFTVCQPILSGLQYVSQY